MTASPKYLVLNV